MSRPPFGTEPNRARCELCHEIVMGPVEYRGLYYHRHCAQKVRREDISAEIISPYMAEIERALSEILDSNPGEL